MTVGGPAEALLEAATVALLEARGFSAREFGIYHPGGRLGARSLP